MTILTPKIVLVVAGSITLLILLALAQEMNRRWQVQQEVQRLEQQVQAMEKNVVELDQLNQYFRTTAYLERVARENLNYQAPGEQVVLIPEDDTPSASAAQHAIEEYTASSPQQWWEVFFVEEAPISEILTSRSDSAP